MSEQSGLGLAATLWGVAIIALALAAFTQKADRAGVASIACVGHALTAVALGLDWTDRQATITKAGRRTTIAYLSVGFTLELTVALLSLAFGERDLALWFGLGASFSAFGTAITWRRVPGDPDLACQLFFHAVILAPLIASLPIYLIGLGAPKGTPGIALGRTSIQLVIMVLCAVAVPLLIVSVVTVLLRNLSRPKGDRDLPWVILSAHQALFCVIVIRWAANGL